MIKIETENERTVVAVRGDTSTLILELVLGTLAVLGQQTEVSEETFWTAFSNAYQAMKGEK